MEEVERPKIAEGVVAGQYKIGTLEEHDEMAHSPMDAEQGRQRNNSGSLAIFTAIRRVSFDE